MSRRKEDIQTKDYQKFLASVKANYEEAKEIGVEKEALEEKLPANEEYSNKVLHELKSVKNEIAKVENELRVAFSNEHYTEVAELGRTKEMLKNRLRGLESNFGKGEGIEKKNSLSDYRVRASCRPKQQAATGQSRARPIQGEIKLWFPLKHFGFIMPDNKPENDPDIFFHGTRVENCKDMPIRRFARVTLSVIQVPKGPTALNVSITSYQPEKEKEAALEAATLKAQGISGSRSPVSANRPKMSIQGQGSQHPRTAAVRATVRNNSPSRQQVLAALARKEKEMHSPSPRSPAVIDLSRNKSIDLRLTTSSESSSIVDVLVVNEMTQPKLER